MSFKETLQYIQDIDNDVIQINFSLKKSFRMYNKPPQEHKLINSVLLQNHNLYEINYLNLFTNLSNIFDIHNYSEIDFINWISNNKEQNIFTLKKFINYLIPFCLIDDKLNNNKIINNVILDNIETIEIIRNIIFTLDNKELYNKLFKFITFENNSFILKKNTDNPDFLFNDKFDFIQNNIVSFEELQKFLIKYFQNLLKPSFKHPRETYYYYIDIDDYILNIIEQYSVYINKKISISI